MKRAALYARVSVDRDEDKATVDRQVKACRELAESKGFTVVDVFEERNLSAFKESVERPKWEELKAGIAEGRYDALFGWRLDRLTRSTSEALKLAKLCKDHGCDLVLVYGNVDTTDAAGEMFFTVSAAFAQFEAESTRLRLKAANESGAKAGKMWTGGRRCFGFGRDGKVIEAERAYILMAKTDILSGVSLLETCRRLNAAGSRTTMTNEWQPRTLKKMLTSPRLVGIRTYHGVLSEGTWEPIMSEGEQARLVAVLDRNAAGYVPPSKDSTRHLLTTLVKCSECGAGMGYGASSKQTAEGRKVFTRYQCKRIPGRAGCGRVAIAEPHLDRYVIGAVREFGDILSALAAPRRITIEDERQTAEKELEAHNRVLKDLRDERFRIGTSMTPAEYFERAAPHEDAANELRAAIKRFDSQLEALPAEKRPAKFIKGSLSRLPGMTIAEQKQFLRQYLKAVVVAPAKSRGGRFDPDRVTLHWRSGEVTTDAQLLAMANEGVA